jgi:hypothetical protein
VIARFVANRLQYALQTFLLGRGLAEGGYVVLTGAALWLHGIREDFRDVVLLVPGLDAEKEVGDFGGFVFEATPTLEHLAPGLTEEVLRDVEVRSGIRVASLSSTLRMLSLTGRLEDAANAHTLRDFLGTRRR